LAHPVAEFAPGPISIFSDYAKQEEIDFDQFPGREAVIIEAGIRKRESHHDPISNRKIDDTWRGRSGAGLFAICVFVPDRRGEGA
jgi:hypothetical protein